MSRILVIISILISTLTFAQTGPGGVGTSANNIQWLRADKIASNPIDNSTIIQWDDQSGNNWHATIGAGTSEPTFKTSIINGKPIIRFSGNPVYMNLDGNISAQLTGSNYSIYTVGAKTILGAYELFLGGSSNATNQCILFGIGNATTRYWLGQNNNNLWSALISGESGTDQFTFGIFSGFLNNTVGHSIYQNGTLLNSNTNTTQLTGFPNPYLGRYRGTYYDVDIAEMLVFNSTLNTAQQKIIDNYLSAKYGISVANDYYSYQASHPNELAGIGRDDAANLHSDSKGSGIMRVNNPSDLNDGEYLFFGHDNQNIAAWSTTDCPNADIRRLNREWRIGKIGDLGTFDITFYTTQIGEVLPALAPAAYTKYVVLVDADGDFTSGAFVYEAVSIGGGNYTASAITAQDGYYVAFGEIIPKIQFRLASSSGLEAVTAPTLDIDLNFIAGVAIDVNYTTANGTATEGAVCSDDFDDVTGVATISIGTSTTTLILAVCDDAIAEGDETFITTLSAPTGGVNLGTNTVNTYTIFSSDQARQIQFVGISSSNNESVSPIVINVSVDITDVLPTTVDYTVTGTAIGGGTDYTLASGTLTIPAGDNLANPPISITINDDAINENIETIVISLSNAIGTTVCLGNDIEYTYSILDNDAQPTIEFLSSSSAELEDAGNVNFNVQLSSVSGRNITVDYTVSGTAIGGGADYMALSTGTLTINAGSANKNISAIIIDDSNIEVDETVIITLSNPSGATLGTKTVHTFTINDNDFFGWKGPGGVGDAVTNAMWLRADKGTSTTTDGNTFNQWDDQSGNANTGEQATANNQPTYKTNIINAKPVVRFDGINDFMTLDALGDGLDELLSTSYTVMLVGARRSNAVNYFFGGSSTNNNEQLFMGWSNLAPLRFSLSQFGNAVTVTGPSTSALNQFGCFGGIYNSTLGHYLYENGTQMASNTNLVGLSAYTSPYLGRRQGAYYEVDIAEMVIYNQDLSNCQRIIVENYLGAKYGLAVANTRYAYSSQHPNDVAGIGRVSSTDMHTAAKGSGIVKIGSASSLDNGDYFLNGHDGGSVTAFTVTEAPSYVERIAREWRADQTGSIGTLTISLYNDQASDDIPAFNPAKIPVIMIDADGDFSAGATLIEMIDMGDLGDGLGNYFQATTVEIPDGYYFSFGQVDPQIQFTLTTSSGQEDATNVDIEVSLNYNPIQDVTVDYSVTGGDASGGGTDYTLTPGTLTISAGTSSNNISFTVVDDAVVESTETIIIDIANPSFPVNLGTNTSHTYSIFDNDLAKKIQFSTTTNTADEAFTPLVVTVEITGGTGNPTTVEFTASGTATNGVDYSIVTASPVTVAGGATTTTITINITDDAIYESTETIILTLSNPSADVNLGTDIVYTYNLLDNDVTPDVEFTYTASSGSEGTTYPSFQVELSATSGTSTVVNYTVTGTASNGGVDFTLADGSATIPAGSTTVNITPVISDDALIESPETIIITLTGATGASLGTNVTYTYTILDNEVWGYTGPGGVGDANFNTLWLRANSGTSTTTDGDFMNTWSDQSGNGNDYSNAGGTVDDPLYIANGLNSRPLIRFDGTSDYLVETDGTSDILGGSYALFTVAARRNTGAAYIFGGSDATNTLLFGFDNNNPDRLYYRHAIAGVNSNLVVNVPEGNTASVYSIFSGFSSTVNGRNEYIYNSVGSATNSNIAQTNQLVTYPNPYISRYLNTYYQLDVAEVIQYNTDLGTTKKNIVENYMAAKYNIPITSDKYAYEVNHGSEVAGIGRESSTDLHTTAQGSGIVRISDASDLNNLEYLLFGHDGGNITAWTSTEAPTDIERLTREWRFDHNGGDVGTISISLETASLPAPSGGYTKRIVMVDADGDFSDGATIYELALADGSYYKATGVSIPDGYYVTFGNIIPKVQFVLATSSGFENVTSPNVQIYINYIPATSITVNYSSADGTATGGGVDFTLALGSTTIVYGTTTAFITPTIFNDVTIESSEDFTITLTGASAPVQIGATNIHTYTINDDDSPRQIYFVLTGASGDESFSTINVTIEVNLVDAINPTTVDYTVTGTAVGGGTDFTLANGTAQVDATFTTTTLTITVNNDILDELDETVIITLSNPTNSILGTNQIYTYTIVDNDNPPTVQFSLSTSLGSEGTTPALVEVALSTISGQDVTVNYDVNVASTATGSGTDYTLANGVLTITAGSTSANISIVIVDDAIVEATETIVIDLSAPSGATLAAITQHTFTIVDNDDIGILGPGGVGNSTNISFWLDANSCAPGAVTTWTSIMNSPANDATIGAGNAPDYVAGAINGRPVIQFTLGNLDYMNLNYGAAGSSIGSSAYSMSVVGRRNANNVAAYYIGGSGVASSDIYFGVLAGDAIRITDNLNACSWGGPNTAVYELTTGIFNLTTGKAIYYNGTQRQTNANTTPLNIPLTSPYLSRNNATYYTSFIAELVQYHIALNTTQQIIVDNYMSSKYAVAMAGNDKFAYDVVGPNYYGNEVIGIGRTSATDLHTAAQGRGIIKIWNSNSLDNTDYLLLGTDNVAMAWTGVGSPASTELCGRKWQFDETGDVGSITISVDKAIIDGMGGLGAYGKYGIILSTDNDFTTTGDQTLYEITTNGSFYEALNVTVGGDKFMTVVRFNPTVQFTLAASSGAENVSPASVQVELNFIPQTDITANYTVADVTATGGGIDYTLADGSVVINAFSTTATIEPVIIFDVITDIGETFTITLTGADNGVGVGATNIHTFTITDVANNLIVEFQQATSSGDESFTSINIVLELNTTFGSDITVDYSVTGGTANDPADFSLVAGTATITAGSLTTNIVVTVVDDAIDESNETIIVTIVNPSAPAILGIQTIHTYTITDNDPSPTVQFTSTASSGSEATANPNIEISISAIAGQDITVDYSVTGGTATGGGTDYNNFSGTATITAGSTTVDITPTIINDVTIESSETIIFTLSNPVGVTLGANTTHTYTILDDENFGITGPGGVGDNVYNHVWYKADDGTSSTVDGSLVNQWDDKSGNGNNASQGTAANQPTYIANGLNSKPVLRFDGTSDYYTYSNAFLLNSNYTAITVSARRTSAAWCYVLGNTSNGNDRLLTGYTNDNRYRFQNDGTQVNGLLSVTALNSFAVYSSTFSSTVGVGKNQYENNSLMTSGTNTGATTVISPVSGSPAIAYWNGGYSAIDLAEVIIYNVMLNTAQLKIVNSYLAAKYGLTISNDKYTYDATHSNEVAGIGRDDVNNVHTAARGTGIIKISNASSLENSDYMLWGHDNGSIASWVTSDAPTDVSRLTREWRFDQIGNVGTVSFTAYGLLGGIAVPGGSVAIVMIDADGNFTSGASIYEMSDLGGGTYEANNVTIADGSYIAIGYITPKVQFTLTSSSGNEPVTSQNIQISLNFVPATAITVNYTVANITATGGGVDYTLASPGSVIISAGSQTANITPTIVNDVFAESNESFSITLTGATAPVIIGTNAMHTFTIVDDDNARLIQFSATSSTADESMSPTLTIQIDNVDAVNPTTVNYTLTGTANGSDYTIVDGIATIPAGSNSTTIALGIINDAIYESNETVIITLSSPTNAGLGTNYIYTYTIIDNDGLPTIAFTASTSSGSEGVSPVTVELTLSTISGADATVFYSVTGGTALGGGTDYTLANGTATITAGLTTGTISITITNDITIETDETIIITISAPSGATLGAITVHTFTIIDEDNIGITGPGGVGSTAFNNIWFSDPVAGSIATWSDISGNANDATGLAGTQPIYNAGTAPSNNKPFLTFSNAGADDYMSYNYVAGTSIASSSYSVFAVASRVANAANYFLGGGAAANANILYGWSAIEATNPNLLFRQGSTGATSVTGQSVKVTGTFSVFSGISNLSSGKSIYEDGNTRGSIANTTPISAISTPYIARYGGTGYNVNVAEIIQYKTALNTAQRRIVENYLGAKFALPINNDLFAYDATFGFEVIGIGRENSTNFHNAAQGRGIVKISTASSFGDGDYLLLGHDNGSIAAWNGVDAPTASGTQRLTRVWRFDETATDIGTITVEVDASTLPAIPAGNIMLLIVDNDDDGIFATGRTIYPMTNISGSLWDAVNVDITNDNRFCIAYGQNISQQTGNFNVATTWLMNIVPSSTETAIIDNTHIVTLTADQTVGAIQINAGGTLDLSTYMLTISTGTITNSGGTFTPNTGTVKYNYNGAQSVTGTSTGVGYKNLLISGTGVKTLSDDIVVTGNLTNSNTSTFDVGGGNFTINLGGNYTNNGVFNENSGTIIFDGGTDQSISAAEIFNNITISKAGGNVTLSNNIVINGQLTLTTGDIVLGAWNITTGNAATISGGATTSYIQADGNGRIIRNFSSTPKTLFYPIGDVDDYSPITLTMNSGTLVSSNISAYIRDIVHPNINTSGSYLTRYWTITPTGITTPNYDINFTYLPADVVGTEADLYVAKYSSSTWTHGSTNPVGQTISWAGVTSFSDITGGDGEALPIELISFNARVLDKIVNVSWITATEINNDFFTIERTTDFETVSNLAVINGAGNSNKLLHYSYIDNNPLQGISYYRLKQTDFDGKFSYSEWVAVEFNSSQPFEFKVYPNPIKGGESIYVEFKGLDSEKEVLVVVRDIIGREWYSKVFIVGQTAETVFAIDSQDNIMPGIYFIIGSSDNQIYYKKIVIK